LDRLVILNQFRLRNLYILQILIADINCSSISQSNRRIGSHNKTYILNKEIL
jgi:hypothetical protein